MTAWARRTKITSNRRCWPRRALSILPVARKLSRHGYSAETPTWGQVAEHFLLDLCGSILETKAFDVV